MLHLFLWFYLLFITFSVYQLIIKVQFTLSSTSRGVLLLLVNQTSIYKGSKSSVFRNIKCVGDKLNSSQNYLLRTYIHQTLEFCW